MWMRWLGSLINEMVRITLLNGMVRIALVNLTIFGLNPLLNPCLYSPNHSLFLRITLRHLLRLPQRLSSEISEV